MMMMKKTKEDSEDEEEESTTGKGLEPVTNESTMTVTDANSKVTFSQSEFI